MTGFDISDTLAPKSDQLDAVELLGGPRTFTVERVSAGNAEQPINVHLAEFPRPWRPGVSMRRVLAYCWGNDAGAWVGRKVTLFNDETVRFGPDVTGGTRISHMSHITETQHIPLLVKRGKSATYTVEPLSSSAAEAPGQVNREAAPDAPQSETAEEVTSDTIAACESIPTLRGWWKEADAATRKLIEARVKVLEKAALE